MNLKLVIVFLIPIAILIFSGPEGLKKGIRIERQTASVATPPVEKCSPVVKHAHQKIFSTFAPSLSNLNADEQKLLAQNEDKIFKLVCSSASVSKGLKLLSPLMLSWPAENERQFHRFSKLLDSRFPLVTKIAKEMRTLYLHMIYSGDLGLKVAQYFDNGLPSKHPQIEEYSRTYADELKSKLPHGIFSYDSDQKVLGLTEGEFDYIIVGSGSAGSVIAHELGKKGKRVLLIERGSFPIPGAIDPMRVDAFKEMKNLRTSSDGAIIIRNAFSVGGGPSVNIDLAFSPLLPSVQKRMNDWKKRGLISKAMFSQENVTAAYEWVKRSIGTRKLEVSEINNNNKALWEGSIRLGTQPSLYDLNRDPIEDRHHEISGKRSSLEKLIIPAITSSNVFLINDAEVMKLEYKKGKVDSIIVQNREPLAGEGILRDPYGLKIPQATQFRIKVKNLILSAGTLGSAELLIRSGIDKLNPNIGKGIVIHPSIPIIGEFEERIDGASGLTASVYNAHFSTLEDHGYIMECMEASPAYLALMIQGKAEEIFQSVSKYNYYAGFGVMLIDSVNPKNQIKVNEDGKTEIIYRLSSGDKKRMVRGIKNAVKMMFRAGAKKVAIPSVELGEKSFFLSESEMIKALGRLKLVPNKTILTSAHMQGSNKMGRDPKTSVVGPDFRLWGFDNVYVVDGSVFPSSIGANPMQSIYTWAKIFSDGIK